MASEEEKEAFREVMRTFGDAVYTTVMLAGRSREAGKKVAIGKWVAFGDTLREYAENKED